MAQTPYPLPRETRESTILVGNGTAGPYGPSTFKVFDTADVRVLAKAADEPIFHDVTDQVTVTKTTGAAFDTVSILFDAPVPTTTKFQYRAARTHERAVSVFKGGVLSADQLEKELSKQATVISEARRDLDDAPQFSPDYEGERRLPPYDRSKALGWDPDTEQIINLPVSPGDIEAAIRRAEEARDAAQLAEDGAEAARDLSQAWAESSTPPNLEDPDSKSAKSWAFTSLVEANRSRNEADRSTLQADRSSDEADRAETARIGAEAASELHGSFLTKADADLHVGDYLEFQAIEITADGANNGRWSKQGGIWVKTSNTTIAALRTDTDTLLDAVIPATGTVRGFQSITTDEPGTYTLEGILTDDTEVDFLAPPDPTGGFRRVFNSRLWHSLETDESEEYVISGLTLAGEVVNFDQDIGATAVVVDDGEDTSATARPNYLRRPNHGNIIEGAIHNQWVRNVRQIGDVGKGGIVYIGAIGERGLVPNRVDAPIIITELALTTRGSVSFFIGWDHQADDHNALRMLLDGLWQTDPDFLALKPPEYPLLAFQRHHNGSSGGIKFWQSTSLSAEGLGEAKKLLGTQIQLCYGQPFRRQGSTREVYELMRQGSVGALGRGWAFARSLDNCTDGYPLFHRVFVTEAQDAYCLWWPKSAGDGGQFFFHNHPDSSGARTLVMAGMKWTGQIWSYARGGPAVTISNPFEGGDVQDAWLVGDVIYTPPEGDRVRMFDMMEVAPDKFFLVFNRWTGAPSVSIDWDASVTEAFTVDVTSGTPVISAPKFVANGGRYLKASNAYQAGASVVRENIVAQCCIEYDPVGDPGKSRFAIWDVSGPVPVKVPFIFSYDENEQPIVLTEYISSQMLARPVTAVKDVWGADGTVKYEPGDLVAFCEISSYPDYNGEYRSRQRWAIPVLS